jgi:uncharacterized membrane protein YcaP (DUF421 family)
MMQDLWAGLRWALGLDVAPTALTAGHMALRALVVFLVAIALVRVGNKRFLGKNTPLDIILAVIFGSTISRAITGNAPFVPTLAASLVLVLVHWVLAALSFHVPGFGTLVKGHERTLIRHGELQWDALRKAHITEHDVHEALRSKGHAADIDAVESAHLERSGEISIILRTEQPPTS